MKDYFKSGMKSRQLKIILIMLLVAASSVNIAFSQKSQTSPSRQSAIDAFSKGNYEQAYNDFGQLLVKYPKDPLYKYYSGVCLVMMKREPGKAVTLLQQSVNGASVVKSLPPDALFYLGRAQQMSGMFADAIESYNLYTGQVGKKAAREQNVPGYIQECGNKKGMVAGTTALTAADKTGETAEIVKQANKPVDDKDLKKPSEDLNSGRVELPVKYEKTLDEALKAQYKADSLNLLVADQKKELEKLPDSEKASMKLKISQNEMLAASYQRSADVKYNEAQSEMNPAKDSVHDKPFTEKEVEKPLEEGVKTEESKYVSEVPSQTEAIKEQPVIENKSVEIFSEFEILPKETAYPDEKIKIDPEVPAGLIYRIQLAVFRNPVAPSFFKGITPVSGFSVTGTDKINYYAGMFRRSSDAKKALLSVKETGFRDAFVVALHEKKQVSADRAAVLEEEWGKRPLFDSPMPADTIPPTLAFRVEVLRTKKALKPVAVEDLRTMAGGRGLDIINLTDGNIVYLIGKFITFESAAEYADLLIRNNYRGAKVVAWLGNKEVPVETARQLFNNLE